MNQKQLKEFLDNKVDEFHQPFFIKHDPISIPHLFTQKQDIEIAGFFAAIFSWGNRKIIINKSKELMHRMNMEPFKFIQHHSEKDLKQLIGFKHRTFNEDDLFYFVHFLKFHYQKFQSLENAFTQTITEQDKNVEKALIDFYHYFFNDEHLTRTKKHISTPAKKSACKRLNMFLRWMVRTREKNIDFGIWQNIKPHQLVIPLDVHVQRVAKNLKLLKKEKPCWNTAVLLTEKLKKFDSLDPVKYDFALFGLGVQNKYLL